MYIRKHCREKGQYINHIIMCFTSRGITITVTVYYYVGKILYARQTDTERHVIYLVWETDKDRDRNAYFVLICIARWYL